MTKLIVITCNCGSADSFVERRLRDLYRLTSETFEPNKPAEPQPIYWEHIKIRQLLRDDRYEKFKQMSKDCGAWEFLSRSGAGSDKVLLLPNCKSWIDLTQDDDILTLIKGKELEELYDTIKNQLK